MIRNVGSDWLLNSSRSSKESLSDSLLDGFSGLRFVTDVEVGAQAHEAGLAGRGEHTFALERPQEQIHVSDLAEHDVRLRRLYSVACFLQPRGQLIGPLVVFGKPLRVVL